MKRIFVVEDEAVVALEIKDHLRALGYEVCGHAARGEPALRQIPEGRPDLVLMDINLGEGISGLEVAERLRAVIDVPVIFLTAYCDAELTERAGRSESFAYIVKPFDPLVLRANIELALVRHDALLAVRERDAFNRSVLDSLSEHLAVLDKQGVVVAVNKAWRRFAEDNGAPPLAENFIGANYFAVCAQATGHPAGEEAATAMAGIRAVMAGDQAELRLEYSCHSPGEQRWFEMHVTPLRGSRAGVVIGHENITERKRAEAALRESEQRYRRLFEEAYDGLFEGDLDGTIIRVNPAFAQMFGYGSSEELVGQSLTQFYADRGVRRRIEETHRDVETVEGVEAEWRKKDGELLKVELFGRVVRGEHGERLGYHGIVRDVTTQKQYDAALHLLSTGLSRRSGQAFFEEVAAQLAAIVGAEIGFVGALQPGPVPRIRTLGFVVDGKVKPSVEYALPGTPCEEVMSGRVMVFPQDVQRLFPEDQDLVALGADGYAAAPLLDSSGQVIGHVGVMTRRPFVHPERKEAIVKLFALRTAAELERQRSEARFVGVFEFAPDALLIVNEAGRIVQANRLAEQTFGYSRDELLQLTVEALVPEGDRRGHAKRRDGFSVQEQPRRMGSDRSRLWALRQDGTTVPVEISLSPMYSEEGRLVVAAIRDVTTRVRAEEERAQLEDQLRQTQKMESLGTLAGGIAHDFNNMLAVIVSSLELARAHVAPADPIAERLDQIAAASSRAADLVKQILVFSRRQPISRSITSVRTVVEEVAKLLRATLPAGIRIVTDVGGDVPSVLIDSTRIHQVLMNLGTNAWHAIERTTGKITVHLDAVSVDASSPPAPGVAPGRYARLQVSDDGKGMDAATIERIFEPFFTTKEIGTGTGLGLAVVHGIVTDHGGAVTVDSVPGRGTTVSVYLPEAVGPSSPPEQPQESARLGAGRVLLIDDEEALVGVAGDLIERLGYQVTRVVRALDALDAVRADPGRFDVVVTDQNMPEMGGLDLARAIAALRSDLPVVLISGNRLSTDDELAAANIQYRLDKPFTGASLGRVLAQAVKRS